MPDPLPPKNAPDRPPFHDLPGGTLRVLQITDPHFYADPKGRLLGVDTLKAFDHTLDAVQTLSPVDLILLTGDLVHDGSPAGYARLRQRLETLQVPVYCLPGNHDDPAVMRRSFADGPVQMIGSARHKGWLLVFLDSTVPGSEGGHLDDRELHRLDRCLRAHAQLPALICLHHQPVPVGSPWVDAMALDNPDRFFAIVDRHPQVKAILWGHIHQVFEGRHRGVRLLAAPSTCVQFLPNQEGFAVDPSPPGLRWLNLQPAGGMETGVIRIDHYPPQLDLGSEGY